MHDQNQDLIQALNNCANACNHCYQACLHEEDVKMMSRCIMLDRACADICQLTASYAAQGSEALHTLMHACAEICKMCAEECGKHHNEHCQKCAEACKHCEEACMQAA